MNKIITAVAFMSIAFFASCNNGNEDTQDSQTAPEHTEEQAPQGVSLGTATGEAIDPSAQPVSGSAAAEGLALNPPHGEPGHRCEIPVGAPLNSDPISNGGAVQQQIQQDHAQPINIQPQQSAVPSGNNPGARLNPPHGQPGHDCAVAVGAPLP